MKNLIFIFSLIFTISANAQVFEFDWAKSFGGTGGDFGKSIIIDEVGNVYTVGSYSDVVDFDPGPSTLNFTSEGGWDIFIQKLSSSGDLIWAKSIGGAGSDLAENITFDEVGNLLITGWFLETADFDPGPEIEELTVVGENDIFILKLNTLGEFIWVKSIGGLGDETAKRVEVDNDGNIYVSGFYQETIDFDAGDGVFNLTSNGEYDCYILKLNSSGEFLWAQSFGATGNDISKGMDITEDGTIYLSGYFLETVDFDPGPGTFNLTADGSYFYIFLLKLDSDGNFVWAKKTGGPDSFDIIENLQLDADGNILSVGYYNDTVDFDPGPDEFFLIPTNGLREAFIQKLDTDGNFIWAKSFGGKEQDNPTAISIDRYNNIYVTGYFNDTVDFDPGLDSFEMISEEENDAFILSLNEAGEFL